MEMKIKPSRFCLQSIVDKLKNNAEEIRSLDEKYQNAFLDKILEKLKEDIKSKNLKRTAFEFLYDAFGSMLVENKDFVYWLAKKLGYKPCRLHEIILKYTSEYTWTPRNSLPQSIHHEIYNYWLKPEVSIISVDRRNGRNETKITKMKYISQFKHLQDIDDENIRESEIIMKKTGNRKKVVSAHKRIFVEPIRQLHKKFMELSDSNCSLGTFYKFKPIYISSPSEREKETCLCMKCTNIHYLLDSVYRYRKGLKLKQYESASNYLQEIEHGNKDHFPEQIETTKTLKYSYFATRKETYLRNGKEIVYTRTARQDKTDVVSNIMKLLLETGPVYLKHRSHVDNISSVFPIIKETFAGRYIELDFSENIAITPKSEVQDAHFSGKQYSLHCSIVIPGENKYVYHLSDDTRHDATFVHEVLVDIFEKWGIKDETVIIKSDNAPSQYKNKYAFASMQNLANKYNVTIVTDMAKALLMPCPASE